MIHSYQEYDEIVSLYTFGQFCTRNFNSAERGGVSRLILGHTHRQAIRYLSDAQLWLNPGSVSYRRRDDPDQTAHYATIADGVMSLKRLHYDLEPLRRSVRQVSLKESEMQAAEWFFCR